MLGAILALVVSVGIALWGVISVWREDARYRPRSLGTQAWQAWRAQRAAWRQVDAVFSHAKIMMEEVAGIRRPGRRRISDSFGSWRNWL